MKDVTGMTTHLVVPHVYPPQLRQVGLTATKLWCRGVVEVDLRAVTDLFDLGLHNYHPFDGQNN